MILYHWIISSNGFTYVLNCVIGCIQTASEYDK